VNSDESSDVVVLSDRYENFVGGWSPDGRRLAFSSNRRGDLDVYTIGTDGKGIRRVVGGPGAQAVNAWLPDGRLVFADSPPDEQTSDWMTVHPDGSNLRRLTFLAGAADPIDWRAAPTAEAR
jgi:Tol biopolymer transport system component